MGFGCGSLSGILNAPLSHEAGAAILKLKATFNNGIAFFDTADIYGKEGDNEIMIGKALKDLPREQVQLASKFGICMANMSCAEVRGDPQYVRRCIETSLGRLGVDYIDLYYQHRIDQSVPIEETVGELKKLVEEGKIRYIGLSEASAGTIRRAHELHPITVQMEYSLGVERLRRMLSHFRTWNWYSSSPLGREFFGGKGMVGSLPSESLLTLHPRFTGDNQEKSRGIYARFAGLVAKRSCTPPQLALAWLLHQGDDVVPIPATTKIENLDANTASLGVKLKAEELKEIGEAAVDEVGGDREYDVFSKGLFGRRDS